MILKNNESEITRINHDLEKEIENFKDFEKLEIEKRKRFESEIFESNAKIKMLENENMVLKQNDSEKRKIVINRCSNIIKENSDLKSKIR